MSPPEAPNLDRLYSIRADGSRRHLHPADVHGRFVDWRRIAYAALIAIYVVMPFVTIGGHPAIHLDIVDRQFFLFGRTFNAQDFWLTVFLLTSIGFGLLFFTAWLGRLWCGWACPQTVFLEGVYRRIERWIEGPREARVRLAQAPWTAGKIGRKAAKHALFLLISLALAHVFLSFFVSMKDLWTMVRHDPREHWVAFVWVMGITGLLYFDFAWFREQLCIVICPYGRLQSVLTDDHSMVIGYDGRRGEPRTRITRAEREGSEQRAGGDCVDCGRCVAVCPTGIDIRNGLQLECIGCAQCIDACDEVMDRVKRPRGLVRYDSLEGLAGRPRKVARPRLAAYGVLLAGALTGLGVGLLGRSTVEANLLRVRGAPYVLDGGGVRNQFELHLVNKNPVPSTLTVTPAPEGNAAFVLPQREITLDSLQSFRLPVFVTVPRGSFAGPFEVKLDVLDGVSGKHRHVAARFLGPSAP